MHSQGDLLNTSTLRIAGSWSSLPSHDVYAVLGGELKEHSFHILYLCGTARCSFFPSLSLLFWWWSSSSMRVRLRQVSLYCTLPRCGHLCTHLNKPSWKTRSLRMGPCLPSPFLNSFGAYGVLGVFHACIIQQFQATGTRWARLTRFRAPVGQGELRIFP